MADSLGAMGPHNQNPELQAPTAGRDTLAPDAKTNRLIVETMGDPTFLMLEQVLLGRSNPDADMHCAS